MIFFLLPSITSHDTLFSPLSIDFIKIWHHSTWILAINPLEIISTPNFESLLLITKGMASSPLIFTKILRFVSFPTNQLISWEDWWFMENFWHLWLIRVNSDKIWKNGNIVHSWSFYLHLIHLVRLEWYPLMSCVNSQNLLQKSSIGYVGCSWS